MPCSPLLEGVTDPLEVLKVVDRNPILRWSEPPAAFYPLRDKGWVEYKEGSWSITKEGRALLTEPLAQPTANPKLSLTEFFNLGDP
jgi:hypothetical protein